jgi:peptide/nickel transport system ATP-binding protein
MTAKSDKKVLKEIKRFNNQKYRDYNKYLKRKRVPENEYITVMKDPNNILEIDNLQAYFYTDIGTVKAVDGVTFDVPMGKTIGVVGESGCGKSVTGLSIMRLLQSPQGQITGGEIRLNQA